MDYQGQLMRRGNDCRAYIHFVWSTHNREPLITEEIARPLLSCISSTCKELGVEVVALNGVEDHVHLLVNLPSTLTMCELARRTKGASSHLATHRLGAEGFKWQDGYAAFSVSAWNVRQVAEYIDRQQEHHEKRTLKSVLEPGLDIG
jgi:putative transposase